MELIRERRGPKGRELEEVFGTHGRLNEERGGLFGTHKDERRQTL